MTMETKNFWPTFEWCANPLIVGCDGRPLSRKEFDFITTSTIAGARIRRIGAREWSFKPDLKGKRWTGRRRHLLRRWLLSLLVCSPHLATQSSMTVVK